MPGGQQRGRIGFGAGQVPCGVNNARGLPLFNINTRITKNITLSPTQRIGIFWSCYNLTNRPPFGNQLGGNQQRRRPTTSRLVTWAEREPSRRCPNSFQRSSARGCPSHSGTRWRLGMQNVGMRELRLRDSQLGFSIRIFSSRSRVPSPESRAPSTCTRCRVDRSRRSSGVRQLHADVVGIGQEDFPGLPTRPDRRFEAWALKTHKDAIRVRASARPAEMADVAGRLALVNPDELRSRAQCARSTTAGHRRRSDVPVPCRL